jgi:hypothetical protein
MPSCPTCGRALEAPFEGAPETPLSGICPNCQSQLSATIRWRTAFLMLFSGLAALLKFVSLPWSPRVNAVKLSAFPFAMEAAAAQLFWRTGLIKINACAREKR